MVQAQQALCQLKKKKNYMIFNPSNKKFNTNSTLNMNNHIIERKAVVNFLFTTHYTTEH